MPIVAVMARILWLCYFLIACCSLLPVNIMVFFLITGDKVLDTISQGKDIRSIRQSCPTIPRSLLAYVPTIHSYPLTDLEKVLTLCKQTHPIPLSSFFTVKMKRTVTKIGDGAFADVYGYQNESWDKLAIKIIPIESDFKYNLQERQHTYKSIQQEMVISMEMSLLGNEERKNNKSVLHYTKNFVQIDRIALCTGKYPKFLMDAWDDFDFRKKADNNRPDVFPEEQLYILISTQHVGQQSGSYLYHSFEEFISIMQQVSISFAVAEEVLQFEHRDLHRGNVLVQRTHQEYIYFRLDGVEYSIKSYGVKATIVDYTLSRITQEETYCISYANLTDNSWLFGGTGRQAETRRKIRDLTGSDWKGFYPRSNVLWLHYLAVTTSETMNKIKMDFITWGNKMKLYVPRILEYQTAKEVFLNVFSPKALVNKG